MFEALNKASLLNKYRVEWVALDALQFGTQMAVWLSQLDNSRLTTGPAKADRKALATEFLQVLHTYKHMLASRSEYKLQSREARMIDSKIVTFSTKYRQKFGDEIVQPAELVPSPLSTAFDEMAANALKRDLLVEKKQLIKFWLRGVRDFNPHIPDVSLTWQYLGNAEAAKVRLFLDVMMKDADKLASMKDPRPFFRSKGEMTTGGHADSSVVWTNDQFKRAVKAEAAASYGLTATGECVLECKGIKATLNAEAFAGASVKAEGSASWSTGKGGQITGSVEAMIGIRIKAEAKIDVADIFLVEASAEAFAGAMAKGEVEITAKVDEVTFKLEAEAFAGAKIKAKGGLTLRMCGYDIIKGEAEAYLAAGVGAAFKLEMSASAFGGAKFGIEAGLTVGVGGGGATKFTVYSDNLSRVANSLYYTAYLTMMDQGQKRHAWQTYFRNLEDNEILFKRADEIIDQALASCYSDYQRLFNAQQAMKQLEVLAVFKTTGALPVVVAPAPH
jgi:hypothetical protein